MLEIKDLYAGYKGHDVLLGVDLRAQRGEIITIAGENGSGKSTLLKTVVGMLVPHRGEILYNGKPFSDRNQRARTIAYLSQGKNVPHITVSRMVLHGRFPYLSYPRRYSQADREKAQEAMERMGISHLAHKPLYELSGGMRQKVYIAMALCQEAEVILMDEPTTYLDIRHQLQLFEIMQELADENRTVIAVLHDLISALSFSNRVAFMDKGRIAAVGKPSEIVSSGVIKRIFGVELKSTESPYYIE